MQNVLDRIFSRISGNPVAGYIDRLTALAGASVGGFGVQITPEGRTYMGIPEQYARGWLRGEALYTAVRGLVYKCISKGHFGLWEVPPHIRQQHAAETRMQSRKKMVVYKNRFDDLPESELLELAFDVGVGSGIDEDEGMALRETLEDMTKTELIAYIRDSVGDRGRNVIHCEYAESVVDSYVVMLLDYLKQAHRWSTRNNEYRLRHREPKLKGLKAVAEAVFKADFARRAVATFDPSNPTNPIGFVTRGTNNAEYYVTVNGNAERVSYHDYKKAQTAIYHLRCQGIEPPVATFVVEPTPRTWGDTLSDHPEWQDMARVDTLMDAAGLEGREREVFAMSCRGYSVKQIADTLGLARNSIGPWLSRARDKMKSADVRKAFEHGPGHLDLEMDRGTPMERVRPMLPSGVGKLSTRFRTPDHKSIRFVEGDKVNVSESPAALAAIAHAKMVEDRKAAEAKEAKQKIATIKNFTKLPDAIGLDNPKDDRTHTGMPLEARIKMVHNTRFPVEPSDPDMKPWPHAPAVRQVMKEVMITGDDGKEYPVLRLLPCG